MTEKTDGVNRKMVARREDYSVKMKKIQDKAVTLSYEATTSTREKRYDAA